MSTLVTFPFLQYDTPMLHSFAKLQKIHFERSGANVLERRCRENSVKSVPKSKFYHTAVFLTDLDILQSKNPQDHCNNFWKAMLKYASDKKNRLLRGYMQTSANPKSFSDAEKPLLTDYLKFTSKPFLLFNKTIPHNSFDNRRITLNTILLAYAPYDRTNVDEKESLFNEETFNCFARKSMKEPAKDTTLHFKEHSFICNLKENISLNILDTTMMNLKELSKHLCIKEHKMNLPGRVPKGMEDYHEKAAAEMAKHPSCLPPLAPLPRVAPPPKMPPLPAAKPRDPGKKRQRGKNPRTLYPNLNT